MITRKLIALAVAVLLAAQIPTLSVAIWGVPSIVLTYAFAVALAHAVGLGLPLFLLLNWKGWANGLSSVLAGFVIGSVPVGIFTWPYSGAGFSSSVSGVAMIVDGVPTLAGWLRYLEGVGLFGGLGAAGGLGFWLVVKWAALPWHDRNNDGMARAFVPTRSKTSVALFRALTVGVMGLSIGILAIPTITKDRSCHNMFRDGRSHISPVLRVNIEIPADEWPVLVQVLREFAENHGLSFRNPSDSRSDPAPYGSVSLCNEAGVNITALETAFMKIKNIDQSVDFYQVQEEAEWRDLARELHAVLNSQWPDKVGYRDGMNNLLPAPDFLRSD